MANQYTGLDFKRFYADPAFWPGDGETYHDDTLLLVDGQAVTNIDPDKIPDASIVQVESGWVEQIPPGAAGGKSDMSLEGYMSLWMERHDALGRVVFECPNERRDRVIAAAITAGATLLSRVDAELAEIKKITLHEEARRAPNS